MTVIITVPHSSCPEISSKVDMRKVGHICDFKAKEFAELLQQALVQRGVKTILLNAKVTRKECDINRPECRSMSFRPRLTKLYCELKKEKYKTWIFDIHSVPDRSRRPDITILDIAETRIEVPSAIHQLNKVLDATLIQGNLNNDILKEARDWNYTNSTLLDINEGISGKNMKQAINAIVDFVVPSPSESCIIQ